MISSVPIARTVLVVVAVVVCAWFVVGIRQAHEVDTATNILAAGHQASNRDLALASSELDAAAFLNPDQTVAILRGRVAIQQGQLTKARRILRAVTQKEPRNLLGWIWYTGSGLGNRQIVAAGEAHIARLDPIDARSLAP